MTAPETLRQRSPLRFYLLSAGWHLVPLLQLHNPPAWVAWKCLETVAGLLTAGAAGVAPGAMGRRRGVAR